MRRLSITIDLDPLSCYYQIHGLAQSEKYERDLVYTTALYRIYEFFQKMKILPTLFVVGDRLEEDSIVDTLRIAVENGYELANHTYSHLYNFSLLMEGEIADEIRRCSDIVSRRLGYKMTGFRAPGYNINAGVFRSLISEGLLYDSSVLPSPFYYFAKCMVIFFYKIAGRKSRSVCGSVRMPFSRREPYYTDESAVYSPADKKILEIPISTAGIAGLPYVGTFMMGYKEWIYRYLLEGCRSISFLNIELHGIDFLDSRDIRDERLLRTQFDLNIPVEKKLDRLRAIIHQYMPDDVLRLSDLRL